MTPTLWLPPVSKFVLETVPVVCVVAIGGYMATTALSRPRPVPAATLPLPPSADLSGQEVTAIVQTAHAAAVAASKTRTATAQATPPTKVQAPATPARHPHALHAAVQQKPAAPSRTAAAPKALPPPAATLAAVEPLPAPAAVPTAERSEQRSWIGRTWGTVANFSTQIAHTTRLDAAAELAVATPGAVARVGRRAVGVVADAILPASD